MQLEVISAFVRDLLEDPYDRTWTYQGFGMLRTYAGPPGDETIRLNVWSPAHAVENVSVIHDHPWDFTSLIVCGALTNHTFRLPRQRGTGAGDLDALSHRRRTYRSVTLRTGEGGGPVNPPSDVDLIENGPLTYHAGSEYRQHHVQLHWTEALPGTVTINDREPVERPGGKVATVCWSEGEWVSAEPRPATIAEIGAFAELALGRFS